MAVLRRHTTRIEGVAELSLILVNIYARLLIFMATPKHEQSGCTHHRWSRRIRFNFGVVCIYVRRSDAAPIMSHGKEDTNLVVKVAYVFGLYFPRVNCHHIHHILEWKEHPA